jgi:hypothetical protein
MSWRDGADAPAAPALATAAATDRGRFHGRGEEMVKGVALGTVLLLQQLPAGEAENFAVAICDMNALLIEKQQSKSAQRSSAS